jgi:hypothetical protein
LFTMVFFMHRFLALLFIIMIPLPFVALYKIRKQTELRSAVIWQNIIRVTNISLVIILLTGITIYPVFSSLRVWVAVILTLAIGGLLGFLSKQLKLYNITFDLSSRVSLLKRISNFGFIYISIVVIIFGLMAHWYQF